MVNTIHRTFEMARRPVPLSCCLAILPGIEIFTFIIKG
jgi:hypothetical protein